MTMMVNTKVIALSKIVNNLQNYDTITQEMLLMNFLTVLQDFSKLRTYNKEPSSLCLTSMIVIILQYLPVHCTYPLLPHSKGIWSMYRNCLDNDSR